MGPLNEKVEKIAGPSLILFCLHPNKQRMKETNKRGRVRPEGFGRDHQDPNGW
jgi:hypothetical protein